MTITFSAASSYSSGVTTQIQEFLITGTPTWKKKSKLRRVWADSEHSVGTTTAAKSIFYNSTPDLYVDSRWAWGDDNPARATGALLWPPPIDRITSIVPDDATPVLTSSLRYRDRSNLLANILSGHGNGEGPNGHLVDASSATLFDDFYFPNPSHLSFVSTGGSNAGLYPMSNVAPVHARNYVQPFLRGVAGVSLEYLGQASRMLGIGGYTANDGLRLLETKQGLWIRPGAPITPLMPWIETGQGAGLGDTGNIAAHGLPEIELSVLKSITSNSFGFTIASVQVELTLTEIKFDGSYVDTIIATVNVPYHSVDPSDGSKDRYLLVPTDSGHSTTLADDTQSWSIQALYTVTRSAGWPFDIEIGVANYWHKRPCHVQPWALSCDAGEATTYLPGSLYDPYA